MRIVAAAGAFAFVLSPASAQSQESATPAQAISHDRSALIEEMVRWQDEPLAFADWIESNFGPEAGLAGARLDFEGDRVLLEWSSRRRVPNSVIVEAARRGLNVEVLSAPLDLNERESLGFGVLALMGEEYADLHVTKVETPDSINPSVRIFVFGRFPENHAAIESNISEKFSRMLNVAIPVELVPSATTIHQGLLTHAS